MKLPFRISILFFTIIISLNCACKKRICENCKVGSVELKEESMMYLSYEQDEVIIFQNSTGQQLSFTNTVVNEPYEICTKLLCKNTTGPFETTPCEYYSTTGIRNVLSNESDSIYIDIAIGVNNYQPESLMFYDFFMINMSKIGQLARGEYVTAVHFEEPTFVLADSEVREPFIEVATITIASETYQDALHSEISANMIYFKVGVGIVALKINDILYELAP